MLSCAPLVVRPSMCPIPWSRRAALALAVTLGATAAWSQPRPSWSLRWDAPAACPGPAAVRARVATLVGGEAQREARVQWEVTVRVDGTGYAATVRAQNEGVATAQTLTAPRCDELAETAALLLAWTVQPEGPPTTPAPAPAAPPAIPPAPTSAASPWSWGVEAGLRADVGLSPGVSPGPFVAFEVGQARWALRLDLGWITPQEALLDARRGGRFTAWTVALSGCARWGVGRWRGGPCVGVEAGVIHGAGVGVTDPAEAWEPWIAARAGGRVELVLIGPLRAVASVAARAPLRRAAFVLDGVGPVHQAPWLGVVGDLGVGVTF